MLQHRIALPINGPTDMLDEFKQAVWFIPPWSSWSEQSSPFPSPIHPSRRNSKNKQIILMLSKIKTSPDKIQVIL